MTVVLDLVTLEKRGRFQALPLSFFHGKWGLHLVVLYLVYGDLRIPWAYRLWRGKGTKALSLLALRLLASLPPWMRQAFRIRVVADAAFGTCTFLAGVKGMGMEGVVGMRHDRRLQGGGRLRDLKRQGSRVYLLGLAFPVWVTWYRYPRPGGGWAWRYVVATFPTTSRTVLMWGVTGVARSLRRRFSIEHFFKAMKGEFSLGQFGQRSAIGVHRFLVLSLLAYLLAHWVRVAGGGSWREMRREAVRVLLPGVLVQVLLLELHALGCRLSPNGLTWPLGGGAGGGGLCRLCRRCKF